mgnify:CR=1 FL=1
MVLPVGALLDGDWKQTKTTNAIMAAPEIPVKPKAPTKQTKTQTKTRTKTRKTTARKTSTGRTRRVPPKKSSGGGGGAKASASSSASSGVKESSDKPQLTALQGLLKGGFAKAREQKLKNAFTLYAAQDKDLVNGYNSRMAGILKSRDDNEKSEVDASFANLSNRARESTDLLAQAASQGAGETDTLKTQLMAIRNWDANQADVNRSYFDTQRSINSSISDLNADTRTARMNLAVDALGDYDQIWTNYYNQRADAYTQMGNVHANPYSDSHDPKSTAYASMAKEASSAWKNPGVNKSLQNWKGSVQEQERKLNNSAYKGADTVNNIKRPEGSTLKKWK